METTPVCVGGSSFGCVNGHCDKMEEKTPKCACHKDYSGDTCDDYSGVERYLIYFLFWGFFFKFKFIV